MKFALVIDRFDRRLGGVEGWTAAYADRLLALGHEVHVVAWGFGEAERRSGVVPHLMPPARGRIARGEAVARIVEGGDFDIVHDTGVGWTCDVLHPHNGAHAALVEANTRLAPAALRPLKRAMVALLPRYREFRRVAGRQYRPAASNPRPPRIYAAVSGLVARDMTRCYGVPAERVRVVPNGVDTTRFVPAPDSTSRDRLRRDWSAGSGPVFLLVAHNFRLKGVATALRAAARLRSAGEDFRLVIAGGRRLAAWRRFAARLGIAEAVRFLGPVADVASLYAAADAVLAPTHYDSFGLTVLEGLACGLPVIVTPRAGVAEIIEDGRHGFVLDDPVDDATLARLMARLLDPEARRAMSPRCRELADRNDFERNVAAMLAVYDEVLAGRRGSRAA